MGMKDTAGRTIDDVHVEEGGGVGSTDDANIEVEEGVFGSMPPPQPRDDDDTPTPISQNSQQQELYCQPCSTRHLASQIARYQAAKEKHEQQKRDCHVRLLDTRLPPTTPDSDAFFDHEPRLSSRHPLPDPN